jgi:hypothetical protein
MQQFRTVENWCGVNRLARLPILGSLLHETEKKCALLTMSAVTYSGSY